MNQNPIYMCIPGCSKISWFPVKKCWCQQNSRNVSRDLYIIWIFLKFHYSRICVVAFRDGGPKRSSPIREHPRKSPSWIGLISSQLYVNARALSNWTFLVSFYSGKTKNTFSIFSITRATFYNLAENKILLHEQCFPSGKGITILYYDHWHSNILRHCSCLRYYKKMGVWIQCPELSQLS